MERKKMSEDKERLISDFNSASNNIKRIVAGKSGDGTEKVYGQSYQALVKAGLKPQIRKRYR